MKHVDLNVRLNIPVNATKVQIENWLYQHFNVSSVALDSSNPLTDVDLKASSPLHIEVINISDD